MLSSLDERDVEAGVRALKMVYQSPEAPKAHRLTADALQRLVVLLSSDNRSVAEVAARVLARCCEAPEQKAAVADAGGLEGLLRLMSTEELSHREAAIDALATLTSGSSDISRRVADSGHIIAQLLPLLKSPSAHVKFLASCCLTNLAPAMPSTSGSPSQSAEMVRKAVLPVLAKLLNDPEVREQVPAVLSQLVADNRELQAATADSDAISKLAGFLRRDDCSPRLKEGTLRALSTLCADREQSRRQLLDAEAMAPIVRALDDPSPQVRLAACMCVRSLSRSAKSLRGSMVDHDVSTTLFRRLDDPDRDVRITASATLCNIVLDFSPVKEAVLAAGCIGALVALTGSPEGELRLNAVWALQNLVYTASSEVRAAVLAAVPWRTVVDLTNDMQTDVQERTLNMLRNQCAHCLPPEVSKVLQWSGGEIYALLVSRVDLAASHPVSHRVQAIYTLVNIAAAGEEEGRDGILEAGLAAHLPSLLLTEGDDLRLAAVWAVINLTSSGDECPGAAKRVAILREAGVSAVLATLSQMELDAEVRERVKTAVSNFVAHDMFTE
ncbi:g4360 [Coccomyxa elongata]